MDFAEATLASITVLLAIISFIACICVCISICKKGYTPCSGCLLCIQRGLLMEMGESFIEPIHLQKKPKSNPNEPNIIVFWLCVVDGLHMIPIIINWTPQFIQYHDWYWNNAQCTIIGVIAQFCGIQGVSFHILLAFVTGYLLCGGNMQRKLKKMYNQRYIHFALINIIPLIGTIIPFFMDLSNGYHMNEIHGDKDCWVIGQSQYIFIAIITISLIAHYTVLLIAAIQFRKSKKDEIIIKLSKFVVIYTIIRFFPLIDRIYEIFAVVPYWLVLLQHCSIASLGMGNALVWFWNSSKDPFDKTNKPKFIVFDVESVEKKTALQSGPSGLGSINETAPTITTPDSVHVTVHDTSTIMKSDKNIINLENDGNERIGEKNTYKSSINTASNKSKKGEISDITQISSNGMNKSNSIKGHNVHLTVKKNPDKRILL